MNARVATTILVAIFGCTDHGPRQQGSGGQDAGPGGPTDAALADSASTPDARFEAAGGGCAWAAGEYESRLNVLDESPGTCEDQYYPAASRLRVRFIEDGSAYELELVHEASSNLTPVEFSCRAEASMFQRTCKLNATCSDDRFEETVSITFDGSAFEMRIERWQHDLNCTVRYFGGGVRSEG